MRDVILHAFDWPWQTIAGHASKIAALGYGAVLLPPPLYSRDDAAGSAWWQRYQPKDYRVIRSYLGNKADFAAAISALHHYGVRVYVDIVFNHMANEDRADRLYFPGAAELARYRQEPDFTADHLYGDLAVGLFSPWDFNLTGNIQNWMDLTESTQRSLSGLPDLNLNEWVIKQQILCLQALNALGVDGYRVDAIKHLPAEHIHRVFASEVTRGKFMFGEALTSNDAEERVFLWPLIDETQLAFYDFPLHETLRRVFSPAGSLRELVDPAAFGQALHWSRAITVSVTHDMPNNDGFRGVLLQTQDEYLANVYLMGRDGGVPLIYSDANQSVAHYPEDLNRWANAWERQDLTAMLRFHNAVHGLVQRSLYEHDGFLLFSRGDCGIVAINKTDVWQQAEFSTYGLRAGQYQCEIHGYQLQLQGDHFNLAIAPRQAQMWLLQA